MLHFFATTHQKNNFVFFCRFVHIRMPKEDFLTAKMIKARNIRALLRNKCRSITQ